MQISVMMENFLHFKLMKKIYLVRHAQSQSNVNVYELQRTPNPNISLTELGLSQAQQAGEFLSHLDFNKAMVWNSPYHRTRQTAQVIKDNMKKNLSIKEKESIYLSERQFGLVDDVVDYRKHYKNEVSHFKMHSTSNTEFFARPPLGESPFDMAIRVDTFMKFEIQNSTEDIHIIVSHGAAIRGILMMTLGWKFEQYTEEPNAFNAAIRLITFDNKWQDQGYVFIPEQKTLDIKTG